MDAAPVCGEKPGKTFFVPNIRRTLSWLFLICTIYLEWTFRLAATKESIVPPKKIKSYAAMTFCKTVGLVSPCNHLTKAFLYSNNNELYWPQSTSLDECLVVSEPLGVVFIVGNWCSPVQMCLVPLVGAIAAGADTFLHFQWIRWSLATVCLLIKYLCRKLCNHLPLWEHRSHSRAATPPRSFLLGQCKLVRHKDDWLMYF